MKTVCPQCHTDGHHKMSCSDESNPCRKDRTNVTMTLKEPIVKSQMEHVHPQMLKQLKERAARCTELEKAAADVVAELRQCAHGNGNPYMAGIAVGYNNAADLVAKKLGVES